MTGAGTCGHAQGAFVLTADGKRDQCRSAPYFAGWEIYTSKGSPPTRIGCTPPSRRLVRPGDPAVRRRRGQLEPVGNDFNQGRTVPTVVRRHAAPLEFARSGTEPSAGRPGCRLRRCGRRRLFARRRGKHWQELPGSAHQSGPSVAARSGGCALAHDPPGSVQGPGDIHAISAAAGSGRTTRPDLAAGERGLHPRGSRTRRRVGHCVPAWHAPVRRPCCLSRSTGTYAPATTPVNRGARSRRPADDFGFPIDAACHGRRRLRGADHQRLAPFPPRGSCGLRSPRGDEWEPLTRGCRGALLRQRAEGCDGRRLPGVAASTSAPPAARCTPRPTGGQLGAIVRTCPRAVSRATLS